MQSGGDGFLVGVATTTSTSTSPTPLLPHFFGNGSGWQSAAAAGPDVEARPRHATTAPPAGGRHAGDHQGVAEAPADTTRTGRHHRPTTARRDTAAANSSGVGVGGGRAEGLSGSLLCLLVDHMKDLKREVRETKRRQDGIEDLLRDLSSKVAAIPSLVAAAVASQSTTTSSSSSSSSPLEDYDAALLSPSVPVLDCTAAVRRALQLSDGTAGGYAAPSFTLLPGLAVVPPRQQIAALFPFLDEYNLGTCDRPFVCDNPEKPVVVLRCISQTSPGEEGTAPIIIYINDPFCSLMGFTRNELVGSPITKLAMPDFAFKDEVAKRFLSPPGTLIGDVFSVSMLVMKRNGMPARAHNRLQYFYNGMRRQRWLFSVTDGLDESNVPFAPSNLMTPAISYRSELQWEQQAQVLEQESMAAFRHGLPARSAPTGPNFCGQQQPTTDADRWGGDFGGNGAYDAAQHGAPYFAYGPTETPTTTTPSSGDGPSPGAQAQQEPFEEEEDSIGDLLASMGGPSPSPLGFPASPYSTFSSFY